MKKKLLFIFALLCAVAQGAWSQRVVDLSKLEGDYVAQDGDVLTGTLRKEKNIAIAHGATVTLSNMTIIGDENKWKWEARLQCIGDATIILADGTTNTINSYTSPGIEGITKNTTITIKGTGSLYAKGGDCCAGIGGKDCNIVIEGGYFIVAFF